MPKITITFILAHFQLVDSLIRKTRVLQKFSSGYFPFTQVQFPRPKSSEILRQRQMLETDRNSWESGIRKSGPQQKEQEKRWCLIV